MDLHQDSVFQYLCIYRESWMRLAELISMSGTVIGCVYRWFDAPAKAHLALTCATENKAFELVRHLFPDRLFVLDALGSLLLERKNLIFEPKIVITVNIGGVIVWDNAPYDAVGKELWELFGDQKLPSVQSLKQEKAQLTERKQAQYESYSALRSQWLELSKLARNRDSIAGQGMLSERSSKKRTI